MIFTLAGACIVAASAVGMVSNTPAAHLKKNIRKVLMSCKCLDKVQVRRVYKKGQAYHMELVLPYGVAMSKLEDHIDVFEQAVATKVKVQAIFGSTCELIFGWAKFGEAMNYDPKLQNGSLAVPLHSPFGMKWLDFGDETSCHLLLGGATRMGKSAFLRMLVVHLVAACDGRISFLFVDQKITDLYVFRGVPQVKAAETTTEARVFLKDVLEEMDRRKEILKSRGDCADMRELREKYPDEKIDPYFVVFDEYGAFADDEMVQEMVMELAERAGYLDIHLVIAAQRPDAKDVLKPRIKANIMTRMSFATFDETNSRITLDLPDAAHIGKIKGRAVLVDGMPDVVQAPFMPTKQAQEILKKWVEKDARSGPENTLVPEAVSGTLAGSGGSADMPGSDAPLGDGQPGHEAAAPGRMGVPDTAPAGNAVPLHAKPDGDPPAVLETPAFLRSDGPVSPVKPPGRIRSGTKRK